MNFPKNIDARIDRDWVTVMQQARAARSAYVGRLLADALKAIVRTARVGAISAAHLVSRKPRTYGVRRLHQT